MDNNELTHHGVPGMKWGVRRYQNKDGSLKPAGKKRYGSLDDKGKALANFVRSKKKQAAQKKAAHDKKEAEEKEAKREAMRKKVRNSRDPELIYKHAGLFSDKEIKEIQQRLENENKIKQLIPKKENKVKKFLETTASMTGSAKNAIENGTKAYDAVSKFIGRFKKAEVADDTPTESTSRTKSESTSEGSKKKVYEGTVVGEGTSKGDPFSRRKEGPIFDGDFTVDNATAVANYVDRTINKMTSDKTINKVSGLLTNGRVELGARYVAGLLPPGKDD